MNQRVIIYARYSSELQREASIDDQIRVCSVRVDREGWKVVDIYADHAASGATTDRPGYQALLARLRSGGIDIVLAESLDRFSRDQEHIAAFYKLACFAGVRIITRAEGEISELHIGLKGTMGALYLKDLAQKTHRGIEGRIRQGRAIGHVPYGYRLVRRHDANGEPDRGLREIDPAAAAVVRRIFHDYASGISPRTIAKSLNAGNIPGPSGGIWYDASIRGRPRRGDGLLRNQLYIGRLVWNRGQTVKDPVTGTRHRRAKDPHDAVTQEVPGLRIVEQDLWEQVQTRLHREKASQASPGLERVSGTDNGYRYWEHRRPRHLLTGKVVCGACGSLFAALGGGHLGCRAARQGACHNTRLVGRDKLEAHVLDILGRCLMPPDLVAEFVANFSAEWDRLVAEQADAGAATAREMQTIQRKIAHLIDALSEGIRSPGLREKLTELEARLSALEAERSRGQARLPAMDPNLAEIYREEVARLRHALDGTDAAEAREAARRLIEQVVIHPPVTEGDPPSIEVIGDFIAILQAGGLGGNAKENQAPNTEAVCRFVNSVKVGSGGTAP